MILVIDSDPATQQFYRRAFYSHGMLTYAVSYTELLTEQLPGDILAILLTNPYDRLMPNHFAYACHTRFPGIPLIMVQPPLREAPIDIGQADITLSSDTLTIREFKTLLLALSRYYKRDVADVMAHNVARDHMLCPAPTWGGTPFYLTPVERAIFRYLIIAGDRLVTAKELLRYCMKPGTSPALSVISTHICKINSKANDAVHTHVIHCPGNIGYTIINPLT